MTVSSKIRSYVPAVAMVAVFASTGLAQVTSLTNGAPVAPVETDQVAPRQHGPMILHKMGDDGTSTSDNWSGYAVTGTSFTQALASWVVPTVDCSATPGTYSSFWVGLDGYSSSTVEQTGTDSDCSAGTPSYYAWYEIFPLPSFTIPTLKISPGDIMSAEINFKDLLFTITITDVTKGRSVTRIALALGARRNSAEWIAEAPTSGGVLPLADFGTVSFGPNPPGQAPGTGISTTNYATEGTGNSIPIGAFGSSVQRINMVSSNNAPEATTSLLSTDGTSFTVTWDSK